jgi:hypothetical protein
MLCHNRDMFYPKLLLRAWVVTMVINNCRKGKAITDMGIKWYIKITFILKSMNIFESIFRHLNDAKIKYLVVGGVAVNLYGFSRFTGDLDIIVLLDEENLKKLDHLMKQMGYSERIPVSLLELKDNKKVRDWLEQKNLKAYSFTPPRNSLLQIDIIIEESLKFNKFYEKKTVKHIDKVAIPIVCLTDLINMKKKANREQDVLDLKSLIELKKI